MSFRLRQQVVAALACALAAGCGPSQAATTPSTVAANVAPAGPVNPSLPFGALVAFMLGGNATGDDGSVIANGIVRIQFSYIGQGNYQQIAVPTDGAGAYQATFDATVGGYDASRNTALMYLDPPGNYEPDFRWFKPSTSSLAQRLDLHAHQIVQITAGDSVPVTVVSTDGLCVNNVQDEPGLGVPLCRTVRVLAPSDGVMTVAVQPLTSSVPPVVESEIVPVAGGPCCDEDFGNPRSIPVTAGTVVKVNVEGTGAFMLVTSMASLAEGEQRVAKCAQCSTSHRD